MDYSCSCLYSFWHNSLAFFIGYTDSLFHAIVPSWQYNPCLCTIHVPSLLVSQPFLSSGRYRWRSGRESPNLSVLGSSGVEHRGLHLAFSSRRRLPSSAPRKLMKEGCHDRLPMGCVLPFDTPSTPPPPPAVFITSLLRLLPYNFLVNHRQSVHIYWNMILLLINYNGN